MIVKKISVKKKALLVFFGSLLSVFILEAGLRIGGFILLSLQEYRNIVSIRQKGTYRIMCLGESTTALGGANSYPSQLEEILNKKNIGIQFSVVNKGIAAGDSDVLLLQLEDNLERYKPNMVISMMGINDVRDKMVYGLKDKKNYFLESFKTYKLMRLLKFHIKSKSKYFFNYRRTVKIENGIEKIDNLGEAESIETDEEKLKRLLIAYSKNPGEYFNLGWFYREKGDYEKAEVVFKEAIELNPEDNGAYRALERCYWDQGKYDMTEEMYKKAVELNPNNDSLYVGLGICYKDQMRFDESEEMFRRAVEINPENDIACFELGRCYNGPGNYSKAAALLERAIEISPNNDRAFVALGFCYRRQSKFKKAEDVLERVIEFSPGNDRAYYELGWCYREQEKYYEAEEMFKKAAEINPKNDLAYYGLGYFSKEGDRENKIEKMIKKSLEINSNNDRACGVLAYYYKGIGKESLSEEYFQKANKARLGFYNSRTKQNYQKMWEILKNKGVKLVCVQYPVRNVESIKRLFEDKEDIVFVDNEKVFKEALIGVRYKEYFTDIFGGDFGHCTPEGNRLLAQNIADVVLREYFK